MVIVGAGGFGLELASEIVSGRYCYVNGDVVVLTSVLDDNLQAARDLVAVLDSRFACEIGSYEDCSTLSGESFCIASGDASVRNHMYVKCVAAGLLPASILHTTSLVSEFSTLGVGVIAGPFSYIGPLATVADNSVLNTYASVGHHAVLGEGSVMSPYAALNGASSVGEQCFLGTRATVSVGVEMGQGSKLSNTSVLTQNCEPFSLSVGNPAKSRVMFARNIN